MKYLVSAKKGPGFAGSEEMINVLEKLILPTFEALMKLEKENIIIAGGLPVGERAFVFIMEASSNEEADKLLRSIPAWGLLEWDVVPLQTIKGRSEIEVEAVRQLKARQ
jgi:hypothetical protein